VKTEINAGSNLKTNHRNIAIDTTVATQQQQQQQYSFYPLPSLFLCSMNDAADAVDDDSSSTIIHARTSAAGS
jgi:hypothetical protein